MKKRVNWKVLIISLAIVFGISLIGGLFTSGNTDSSWYTQNKPSFNPPNWVFGPVWTVLYILIALSLYFVWIKAKRNEKKKVALIFGINLIANALWSYLFFEARNPSLAFIDLLAIFGTIIGMMIVSGKIEKKSAWLLVPYLLWVAFAGILNFSFVL